MERSTSGTGQASRPSGGLFARVYVRSLGLQGSWNGQRMQNLGFLVSLLPWLGRRDHDREQRRRFCRRHYEFFNTNPYLANLIIGGVLRLEDEAAAGRADEGLIGRFKDSLARSTASLGDQLFWLGLQPSVLLLACLLAFWGRPWVVMGLILALTVCQLELRRRLLLAGYSLGLDVVDLLVRPGWHRAIAWTKRCAMVLTGAVLGCYLGRGPAIEADFGAWQLVGTFGAGLALVFVFRKRVPPELIFLLAGPLALLLT